MGFKVPSNRFVIPQVPPGHGSHVPNYLPTNYNFQAALALISVQTNEQLPGLHLQQFFCELVLLPLCQGEHSSN